MTEQQEILESLRNDMDVVLSALQTKGLIEMVSLGGIAAALGCSTRTASRYVEDPTFPAPTRGTKYLDSNGNEKETQSRWDIEEVNAWFKGRG